MEILIHKSPTTNLSERRAVTLCGGARGQRSGRSVEVLKVGLARLFVGQRRRSTGRVVVGERLKEDDQSKYNVLQSRIHTQRD